MYRDQIRSAYEQFSPGYRRIADFILTNYQDAAFMTAAEVGRAAQVDTALVVRFAQRLGYPGFPELIAAVQEHVKQELRAVYQPPEGDNSPVQVFRRNLLHDRNNLDYMLLHLDEQNLTAVFGLFHLASRIFVIGEGNASHFAEAFVTRLLMLDLSAHTIPPEATGQAAIMAILKPTDLVVGIAATTMNPSVVAVIRKARTTGAQTIGIVPSMTHPVAAAAQLVLHTPIQTAGIMPSWTAIAATLQAVVQVLAVAKGDLSADWVLRTDHFLKIYEDVMKAGLSSACAGIAEYNRTR